MQILTPVTVTISVGLNDSLEIVMWPGLSLQKIVHGLGPEESRVLGPCPHKLSP